MSAPIQDNGATAVRCDDWLGDNGQEPPAARTSDAVRSGAGGWLRRERDASIRAGLFVCYECKDDRCGYCIGIPCMCECPIPETEPEYSI